MTSLLGKTALITGASGGLGAHFARTLVRAGANVVLTGRRRRKLDMLAEEIAEAGGSATAMALDVTEAESIDTLFVHLKEQGVTADLLINNSGVASRKPATEVGESDWDVVIDTNLKGAWLMSQAFARALVDQDKPGAIVNIVSILGKRVSKGVAPYAVSKAGLDHMTRALALEWARFGIRVNAIAPGYFETDINRGFLDSDAGRAMIKRIPQRRTGRPEDLDGPLLLLASEASSYITGSTLVVDGGHLCSSL